MAQSLRAQIDAVRLELESRPPGLVRHIERVVTEAVALAAAWDIDPERAELAAWGHDLFRSHSAAEQLQLARDVGIAVTEDDEALPVMLHGPIAGVVLRERFGVLDKEVVAAVRDHTAGAKRMSLLAKVILLADKVEKRKRTRTPVMGEIRRAARRDLDLALLCWADWKWVDEREREWRSYAAHWKARVAWVAEHHADLAMPMPVALPAPTRSKSGSRKRKR